jgi:GDP-L-fucose synthase
MLAGDRRLRLSAVTILCRFLFDPVQEISVAIDLAGKRVVVTGGAGFVGRVVCDKLRQRGCRDIHVPRRDKYDLTHEDAVKRLYADMMPDVVIHLAAEVGGIGANMDNPGRFFFANMAMALHLIEHARINNIEKFVQVGTICAYPKFTPVPFKEEDLWNGYPEETNAPYGVAKKAALVMLDGYHRQYGLKSAYVLPVNLYGPHDNFDLHTSHVIPALIRKCIAAIENGDDHVTCWGTGNVSREFLYVDDAAEGILRAAEVMDEPVPINLGTQKEIMIRNLVHLIAKLTGFEGDIRWDSTKPDGQPRRCLDTTRAKNLLGWQAQIGFEEGLRRTIDWWRSQGAGATKPSSHRQVITARGLRA